MSITAKQRLIKEVGSHLRASISAETLDVVQEALNDALEAFDMEEIPVDDPSGSDDLLTAFLEAKKLEGRSPGTIARYEDLLGKLFADINVPTRQVTVFHLRGYLARQKARGISDGTLEGIRCIICSYFSWLYGEGLIKSNPAVNLAPIKCVKRVRYPFSDADIACLNEACRNIRDRALMSFLLSTGCRISEVCALNRDSVDLHSKECKVLGKGNKERVVFFDDVTAMYLKRYLTSRKDNCPALFASHLRDRITPRGVRNQLTQIGNRAGVTNVHPHRFRRTRATSLINHGMPIQEVAAILGHDKLDTTMQYVYISKEKVKNSYSRYA